MNLATALPLATRLTETLAAIRHGFRVHALLHGLALTMCTIALVESMWFGLPLDLEMVALFSAPTLLLFIIMIICGLGIETIHLARSGHDGSAVPALGRKIRDDYLAPSRISNALHTAVFMSLFMAGYASIKKTIPLIRPFDWDETFVLWDNVMHFGKHPYEILAPFLNIPSITYALSVTYVLWFSVMFACWFWQGFDRRDTALRQQFLLSFGLTWFIGTSIVGTLLSSVGPCFYGKLLPGPDPFAPLMTWLHDVNQTHPIWSLNFMDELWKNYLSGAPGVNGISAMPSMHVGTSLLCAFVGFASGQRWLGWLLSAFGLLIFVGSIHLGWHYAIDGYGGALVAVFGWWAAGRLVAWDRRLRGVA